jgi:hypothetical protein
MTSRSWPRRTAGPTDTGHILPRSVLTLIPSPSKIDAPLPSSPVRRRAAAFSREAGVTLKVGSCPPAR